MIRLLLLAGLVVACSRPPPRCPSPPRIAALGETLELDSTILGERRVINVYVPPGYADGADRFPVLYMPDGGMAEDFPHVVGSVDVSIKNAVIRPVIVVGIENTERRRDLVAKSSVAEDMAMAPLAGGADAFRAFLRDELMPMIDARYRTTDEAVLIGESLAGLFAIETMLLEPTLFDGYIAADPSLWWNAHALVDGAADRIAAWPAAARSLFFTTGNDSEMEPIVAVLTAALATAPDLAWIYEPMPAEQHSTIFPTTALHGIRRIFAP